MFETLCGASNVAMREVVVIKTEDLVSVVVGTLFSRQTLDTLSSITDIATNACLTIVISTIS